MHHEPSLKELQKLWHGSLHHYAIGFTSCLILTGISFLLAAYPSHAGKYLIPILAGLALVQATIQLRYFLHLGEEEKPRWESLLFYCMLVLLLVIVGGSLWIMQDLNQRMMHD